MFGGWEVRISQIAKYLAKCTDYELSIIVADYGQTHREVREGVKIVSWTGKQFYGVPAFESQPPAIPEVSAPPASCDTSAPFPPPEAQQANRVPAQTRTVSQRLKKVYKRSVPWRARIIITGLLAGTKAAAGYLVRRWIELLKYIFRDLIEAAQIFHHRLQEPISISRRAFGNIADVPVFREAVQIFEEVDADIYIVPGNSQISAIVAAYTRAVKKVFIMLAGSDLDFDPAILEQPNGADIYGELYSVKEFVIDSANSIIVQHELQAQLARRFGKSSVVIGNPVNMNREFIRAEEPETILWVGNSDERIKRPSIVLEVARSMPEYSFVMVVTPVSEDGYQRVLEASKDIPNLTLASRVPFKEIEKYFAQAKLFINTSVLEGFPNTFLQAGKYGVPIVSLKVDPNRMLSQHGSGFTCNDQVDDFRNAIKRLFDDPVLYQKSSENILEYVRQNHDIERVIPKYLAVFQKLLKRKGSKNIA
jgi:glycosyltransferase involved in cell wall biosynthesis